MINNLLDFLTYENIYLLANWGVIPLWLLLIILPNHILTNFLVQSIIPTLFLAGAYVLVAYNVFLDGSLFDSFELYEGLDGLYSMFSNEAFLLIFWLHFLAISLFIGSWISRDSQKYLINKFFVIIALILTYFTGPIGLIIYWLIRIFTPKKLILMIKSFDFYFDFISPYSFLAHKEIRKIENKNSIKIKYKPILLGGLHNLHGIKAPAFIPAKAKHMIRDCKLIAEKNKVKFKFNTYFPIKSLNLMRGVLVAEEDNFKSYYIDSIFDSIWQDGLNMNDESIIQKVIKNLDVNPKTFFLRIGSSSIKKTA